MGQPADPWTACVLTIFPEMFPGPLGASIAGQALAAGHWDLRAINIRDHTVDRHGTVDDAPFGGGPGMVMRADVLDRALAAARSAFPTLPLIYLSPRGERLDQERICSLARAPGLIVLCGRYEGIDERILEVWQPEEISIGDFVLSGGEPAAFVLLDACVRLLPGVIGEPASLREESFAGGLLEYPQYTRPRVWRDRVVPEVLTSGHHARIAAWRREQAERITRERRPDLWARYQATVRPAVAEDASA